MPWWSIWRWIGYFLFLIFVGIPVWIAIGIHRKVIRRKGDPRWLDWLDKKLS